jgi:hypothetical protein
VSNAKSAMKVFTVEEANGLLPSLRPKLLSIQQLYERIDALRDEAKLAAGASGFGGGMAGGTVYVDALYRIGKHTTEIVGLGVELKDPRRGLIDFPSNRGSRIVLLCWQLGEGDRVEWWHELETGFAGRTPL